ncbi:hypothetical protein CHUAL_010686 [Chamberlinius hualienensis]
MFFQLLRIFCVTLIAECCQHPGKSAHVLTTLSKDHIDGIYPVGTTVTYSCDSEYDMLNNVVRKCLPNGTWTGIEPFCGINVATTANVMNITNYEPNADFKSSNIVYYNDNSVLSGFYEHCTVIERSRAIVYIHMNKSHTVDLLKLTFKNSINDFAVPNIYYSPRSTDWENITMIKYYTEDVYERRYSTFQFGIDNPTTSRNAVIKIIWPSGKEFSVCDVSLYSKTALPESWCSFRTDLDSKYFSYENSCFAVYPRYLNTTYNVAVHKCKIYKEHLNSSLINLMSSSSDDFYMYIKSNVAEKLFHQSYFWLYDTEHQCTTFNISQKVPNVKISNCESYFGRICQYNLHRCGTPDQKSGTLMKFNETTASYFCPNNYVIVGNSTRTCLTGKWTLKAPKCEQCGNDSCMAK